MRRRERRHPRGVAARGRVALRRGDETEALALAKQALDELPEFEVLLRARVAAVAGEAALELGLTRQRAQQCAAKLLEQLRKHARVQEAACR